MKIAYKLIRNRKQLIHASIKFCTACLIVTVCVFSVTGSAQTGAGAAGMPPDLTFDELVTLSKEALLSPELKQKLDLVLNTAVVSINPNAQKPHRPVTGSIGPVLRLAEWNVERGLELENIERALASPDEFIKHAQQSAELSAPEMKKLREELVALGDADVLVLNEVDIGVKRTDYRNVVQELAESLGMHSAYAVEFLEVDPLLDLGTTEAVLDTPEFSAKMTADLKPDPARFRGMHVNAILSRYPIQRAKVIELPVCHDWYGGERREISQIEKGKRKAADKIFLERIGREIRRGNRNALSVSLAVPESPGGSFTVVNVHLENKGKVNCRRQQMDHVLREISGTAGPVVVAGDLNTTGTDGTPTSVRYELATRVSDYEFWLGKVLKYTPAGAPMLAMKPLSYWRNFRDPTVTQIPLVGKNPEAQMFANARKFRFADGGMLDFAGSPERNDQHKGGTLSDSNQRGAKGFVPTFAMQRSFGGLFQYRLDWILVKPSGSGSGYHPFQPDFPATMKELNDALPQRLSDHAPITVDLPLGPAYELRQ